MSFPSNPTNNQTYINSIGTQYRYVSVDNKWVIDSVTNVGAQGATGISITSAQMYAIASLGI